MKKLILPLLLVCSFTNMFAQMHKCYTDNATGVYQNNNVNYRNIQKQNELIVQNWIAANKSSLKTMGGIITIPVVFHVVYKNATQNIADSNIFRQLTELNECYRKQNSNFSQTRPVFDSIGADVQIEFCLAQFDPNGNPTQGITRTSAPSSAAFDPLFNMDKVKSSATDGVDPWPTDQYLNIWVCDMSFFGVPFVLGYATFPGSDPALDGVVIQYDFIGHQNNGTSNNLGKTTVHEVGHWLGMRHIWGDGQQSSPLCDSTDYVDDTPNADTASQQTCMIKNSCSNESPFWSNAGIDPPDMIENYMDYSYDACMTMFTYGQKARMLGFLNTIRSGLITSPAGCNPIGLDEHKKNSTLLSVFPNPANTNVTLNLIKEGSYSVRLTDVLGKELKVLNVIEKKASIDLSSFPSGVIFYSISENGHVLESGKLIKCD
ncbi:MAG: M43 family zinc metalloprotease [Bacteroidota bacterium]|nr:M43 family zinc metalloprotease [Bacteroidota bacterium]